MWSEQNPCPLLPRAEHPRGTPFRVLRRTPCGPSPRTLHLCFVLFAGFQCLDVVDVVPPAYVLCVSLGVGLLGHWAAWADLVLSRLQGPWGQRARSCRAFVSCHSVCKCGASSNVLASH